MKIKYVDIQNFRKLKCCRVELDEKQTIFVGANNSGKTTAMDALIFFLKDKKKITTREFTLDNWNVINEIGKGWIDGKIKYEEDLKISDWEEYLPQLDLWIEAEENEIHYVSHLIPTLDWTGKLLGLRLRFEPENLKKLYEEFLIAYTSAHNVKQSKPELKLWPISMWDFLDKNLHTHFTRKAYILDPSKANIYKEHNISPQSISEFNLPLKSENPLEGLIKIDIINAQRGFNDANSSEVNNNLSSQLRDYFNKHLNPYDKPEVSDIIALDAIENAKNIFDDKLKERFKDPLSELGDLNYPGFGNAQISVSSQLKPVDGLNHSSAVLFNIAENEEKEPLRLPEQYNGLGYQNLISMVFKLIRFRDEWMQVGKISHLKPDIEFEPLHLVLIEEPEAHLHAQVQQVFIRKAYDVLRKNVAANFSTQLIVSTHSNHIAHEVDFTCLRYFKRIKLSEKAIPTSRVINLSNTFGDGSDTTKFAIRYLKTTHCDLFFADAVILVEGPAERMIIPHLIKTHYLELDSAYISIIEIGGSHSHRLKRLIENLGIITLIITDIDSIEPKGKTKILPERSKKYRTGNNTLKSWLPEIELLDGLYNASNNDKLSKCEQIRVAYQIPLNIDINNVVEEALPYTFEDSLIFNNITLFKTFVDKGGWAQDFASTLSKNTIKETSQEMFKLLEKCKKAEFALELLFLEDPATLSPPNYIKEGLDWLQERLITSNKKLNLS